MQEYLVLVAEKLLNMDELLAVLLVKFPDDKTLLNYRKHCDEMIDKPTGSAREDSSKSDDEGSDDDFNDEGPNMGDDFVQSTYENDVDNSCEGAGNISTNVDGNLGQENINGDATGAKHLGIHGEVDGEPKEIVPDAVDLGADDHVETNTTEIIVNNNTLGILYGTERVDNEVLVTGTKSENTGREKSVADSEADHIIKSVIDGIIGDTHDDATEKKQEVAKQADEAGGGDLNAGEVRNTEVPKSKDIDRDNDMYITNVNAEELKTPEGKVSSMIFSTQDESGNMTQFFSDPKVLEEIVESCEKAESASTVNEQGGKTEKSALVENREVLVKKAASGVDIQAPSFSIGLTQLFDNEATEKNAPSVVKSGRPEICEGSGAAIMSDAAKKADPVEHPPNDVLPDKDRPDEGTKAVDFDVLFPHPFRVIYDPNYVAPTYAKDNEDKGRGKRVKKPGKSFKSPYVERTTNMDSEPSLEEKQAACWVFTTFGKLG